MRPIFGTPGRALLSPAKLLRSPPPPRPNAIRKHAQIQGAGALPAPACTNACTRFPPPEPSVAVESLAGALRAVLSADKRRRLARLLTADLRDQATRPTHPVPWHRPGCRTSYRWCCSGAWPTPHRQPLYWWRLDTPAEGAAHETSAGFAAADEAGRMWG